MKMQISELLNEYLKLFPSEASRQARLTEFLKENNDSSIIDWNNFSGHIVASGFIYAKRENKFLVLYHKDMKSFSYPGGHMDNSDDTPLITARREVKEETGLYDLKLLNIADNDLIPIDIDTHIIPYNERLNIPEHYHFDFRYLFYIDTICDIKIDSDEHSCYKWIDIQSFLEYLNNTFVRDKIDKAVLR